MALLTLPPLLAEQFRADLGIHSEAGISGAPGGSGGSLVPNAYQSIQVPETLPASLRGTNSNVGPGAPGEAGPLSQAQTTQGGQRIPGQGQIPSQPGQSQPLLDVESYVLHAVRYLVMEQQPSDEQVKCVINLARHLLRESKGSAVEKEVAKREMR